MSNMNGTTRKKLYTTISKRDGELCRYCNKLPSEGQLVIDHINNNNSNNSLENLQLLCRACNYKKNPRRPLDLCVTESKKEDSISINRLKELKFREFVYAEIENSTCHKVLWDEIISDSAEVLEISRVTAER